LRERAGRAFNLGGGPSNTGWPPSVRLFEAAACGVPVVSDRWQGLDELFADGAEIVIADSTEDVLRTLREIPDDERRMIGARARRRVLAEHTAGRRVDLLEELVGVAV
jgi:spore maturation protein CgeB